MDAVDLRKEYGRDLLMIGNISRQAMMDGKDAIKAEVDRKIPYLMESGGFIPAFDDAVPRWREGRPHLLVTAPLLVQESSRASLILEPTP